MTLTPSPGIDLFTQIHTGIYIQKKTKAPIHQFFEFCIYYVVFPFIGQFRAELSIARWWQSVPACSTWGTYMHQISKSISVYCLSQQTNFTYTPVPASSTPGIYTVSHIQIVHRLLYTFFRFIWILNPSKHQYQHLHRDVQPSSTSVLVVNHRHLYMGHS